MPSTSDNAAFQYADRICGRLPRALQDELAAAGMSRYALEKKCGVSRDMLGDIEHGKSIPTLHFSARMADGLGMKLSDFVRKLEDD